MVCCGVGWSVLHTIDTLHKLAQTLTQHRVLLTRMTQETEQWVLANRAVGLLRELFGTVLGHTQATAAGLETHQRYVCCGWGVVPRGVQRVSALCFVTYTLADMVFSRSHDHTSFISVHRPHSIARHCLTPSPIIVHHVDTPRTLSIKHQFHPITHTHATLHTTTTHPCHAPHWVMHTHPTPLSPPINLTLTEAAQQLAETSADIATNWAGGFHFAEAQCPAQGQGYTDCVLAVNVLRATFGTVLYINPGGWGAQQSDGIRFFRFLGLLGFRV